MNPYKTAQALPGRFVDVLQDPQLLAAKKELSNLLC